MTFISGIIADVFICGFIRDLSLSVGSSLRLGAHRPRSVVYAFLLKLTPPTECDEQPVPVNCALPSGAGGDRSLFKGETAGALPCRSGAEVFLASTADRTRLILKSLAVQWALSGYVRGRGEAPPPLPRTVADRAGVFPPPPQLAPWSSKRVITGYPL